MSNIIIGTGNYANVLSGNTVSVTGDGGNAWNYYGPAYKKLAPRLFTYTPYAEGLKKIKKLLKEGLLSKYEYEFYLDQLINNYIKSFYESRLKNLDTYELLNILENLFGKYIILLCHEPVDEFCHRRLIADYIYIKTGIYIPEISIDKNGNIKELKPISYVDKLQKLMK